MIMKHFLIPLLFGFITLHAQVGIGTEEPKATMHIEASSINNPTGTDGILVPKIKNFPSQSPTRVGQIVFFEGSPTQTQGFYYYDSTAWIPFPTSINREVDGTVFSFDGEGYVGTGLVREVNLSKFHKMDPEGFSVDNNRIHVGKSGLYLITYTGSVKRPGSTLNQSTFTYSAYVNNGATPVLAAVTNVAGEPNSSTGISYGTLVNLSAGDEIHMTVTKTNEGTNAWSNFGSNNLTLTFIRY
jgi:hypothetical protein